MIEPPPPPSPQSPCAAFLQRAAPIIARERGLTPRAQLLLESLANDMQLARDDFDQAMLIVQSGAGLTARAVDPARLQFQKLLRQQLKELKAGILSARHEQTLTTFAVTQLLLAEDDAREDIHTLAAEVGLRRVPLEEALRFVEDIVAQKIGTEAEVDSAALARFYLLGRDWGLERSDVDELIRYRLEENAARRRRERLWNLGMLGGTMGVVAFVLVALIVVGVRSLGGGRGKESPGSNGELPGPETPLASPTRPPEWWDTDLTIAVSQVRNQRDDFAPVYDALIATEAQRRAQGYELLIDRAAATPFDYRAWKPLEPVILGCYALEPDEAVANALRRAWLAVPQRVVDEVPASAEEYQAAIRPVNSAVRSLHDARLSDSRKQSLTGNLGVLLQASLDRTLSEDDLQRATLAALARVLLEQLSAAVESRPEVLTRHYATLAALARDRMSAADQARLDAIIAAAALEHAASAWTTWEPIFNRGLESRDSLAVLRIVDAWERCGDAELRQRLAPRLLARLGIATAGLATDQYADAMRQALGVTAPADTSDANRWARLKERAEIALQQSQGAGSDEALLKQTVTLAWNVNLAFALSLPRPQPEQFDRWLAAGPPSERKVESSDTDEPDPELATATVSTERLTRDQQEAFQRYAHDLGEWQKVEQPRRVSYLRAIVQLAPQLPEITPVQGRQLAAYLLGDKEGEEQAQVLTAATAMRHWKQLRIAMVDQVDRAQLEAGHLRRLIVAFSGQDLPDIETDRAAARRVLLESIVRELDAGDARTVLGNEVNLLAQQLATVYRERAQLLGASASEVEAAQQASALLRMAVVRLPGESAKDGSSNRLIASAEILGESDVQQCVILQRVAIERTAAWVSRRSSQIKSQVQRMLTDFNTRSASAKSAIAQLSDGERTLLELHMLRESEVPR